MQVETEIRAADAAAVAEISSTLGTGDALKQKLTVSLKSQGLEAPTEVESPKPWADYPLLADCDSMKGAEQVVWDDGRNCDRWDEYMKYSDPGVPAHVKSRCCIQQETPTVAVAVGLGVGGCVFLFLSCIAIYVCTRRKMQKKSTVLPTPMATAVIQQPVVGQSYNSQSWVQQTGVEVTAETTPQQLPFQGQLAGAPDMSKSIMKFCER